MNWGKYPIRYSPENLLLRCTPNSLLLYLCPLGFAVTTKGLCPCHRLSSCFNPGTWGIPFHPIFTGTPWLGPPFTQMETGPQRLSLAQVAAGQSRVITETCPQTCGSHCSTVPRTTFPRALHFTFLMDAKQLKQPVHVTRASDSLNQGERRPTFKVKVTSYKN